MPYARPMCVCVLFVSSTSDIVFNSEGDSPVFKFQLYMEDAGNRKPLLVLLNLLSNNEFGPIFKSRSQLTSNDSIILTQQICYSIKVSECIIWVFFSWFSALSWYFSSSSWFPARHKIQRPVGIESYIIIIVKTNDARFEILLKTHHCDCTLK